VFTPSPEEIDRARRIIDAMQQAAAEGKGAVSLDGKLIDAASIKMAENMVRKADQMPVDVASA
jgi:malyl-CoA/(S)-citramalyl-CoA lyase